MSARIDRIIYNEKEYVVESENNIKSWNITINGMECNIVKVLPKKRGMVAIVPGSDEKLMLLSNNITLQIMEIDPNVGLEEQAMELLYVGVPKILDFILIIPFLIVPFLLARFVSDDALTVHLLFCPTVYLAGTSIPRAFVLKPTFSLHKKRIYNLIFILTAVLICAIYSFCVYLI